MKIYALFAGTDASEAMNEEAWNYGIDQAEVVQTIDRILSETELEEGETLTIKVRQEEE